jgi:hypothetical protein
MRRDDRVERNGTATAVPEIALTIGCLLIVSVMGAVGALDAASSTEETPQPTQVEIGGEALRISVPPGWRKIVEGRAVMFAPADAQTRAGGKTRISYGIELGATRTARHDLSGAFEEMVQSLESANPQFRSASITRLVKLAGHLGLRGTFENVPGATSRPEFVIVATATAEQDNTLYLIGRAPQDQFGAFRPVFEAILLSMEKAR